MKRWRWAAIALIVLCTVVLSLFGVVTVRVPEWKVQSTALQWDPRLDQLHISAEKADYSQPYFKLLRAWVVVGGDWATAPAWATAEQGFPGSGGDHHVFGRLQPEKAGAVFRLGWPDGQQFISPAEQGRTAWADQPIYATYPPNIAGPYSWGPVGNSERISGLGLPEWLPWNQVEVAGGHHLSYFFCWTWVQPAMPTATSAPTATAWPTLTPVPGPTETPTWLQYDLRLFGRMVVPVELRER